MSYEYVEAPMEGAKIKVIGVGGGGGNALNCIACAGIEGNVDYIAIINTDIQALKIQELLRKYRSAQSLHMDWVQVQSLKSARLPLRKARKKLLRLLRMLTWVFVTAGMGGGTGTGAAPCCCTDRTGDGESLLLQLLPSLLNLKGPKKMEKAEKGIEQLLEHVDALIVIPNQNLLTGDQKLTMRQSYTLC